jgi:hypothetical protein
MKLYEAVNIIDDDEARLEYGTIMGEHQQMTAVIERYKRRMRRIENTVKQIHGLVHESSEQSRVFLNILNAVAWDGV